MLESCATMETLILYDTPNERLGTLSSNCVLVLFFFITKYNTNVLSRVVIIIEFKGSASPLSVQMKQTNTLCYYVSAIIRV